jgi:hypothetical protein
MRSLLSHLLPLLRLAPVQVSPKRLSKALSRFVFVLAGAAGHGRIAARLHRLIAGIGRDHVLKSSRQIEPSAGAQSERSAKYPVMPRGGQGKVPQTQLRVWLRRRSVARFTRF